MLSGGNNINSAGNFSESNPAGKLTFFAGLHFISAGKRFGGVMHRDIKITMLKLFYFVILLPNQSFAWKNKDSLQTIICLGR